MFCLIMRICFSYRGIEHCCCTSMCATCARPGGVASSGQSRSESTCPPPTSVTSPRRALSCSGMHPCVTSGRQSRVGLQTKNSCWRFANGSRDGCHVFAGTAVVVGIRNKRREREKERERETLWFHLTRDVRKLIVEFPRTVWPRALRVGGRAQGPGRLGRGMMESEDDLIPSEQSEEEEEEAEAAAPAAKAVAEGVQGTAPCLQLLTVCPSALSTVCLC